MDPAFVVECLQILQSLNVEVPSTNIWLGI